MKIKGGNKQGKKDISKETNIEDIEITWKVRRKNM